MAFIFTTESGSKHVVDYESKRYLRVRDSSNNLSADLRRDGEVLQFSVASHPHLYDPLTLFLEPLGEGSITLRETARVVEITEITSEAFLGFVENSVGKGN